MEGIVSITVSCLQEKELPFNIQWSIAVWMGLARDFSQRHINMTSCVEWRM